MTITDIIATMQLLNDFQTKMLKDAYTNRTAYDLYRPDFPASELPADRQNDLKALVAFGLVHVKPRLNGYSAGLTERGAEVAAFFNIQED